MSMKLPSSKAAFQVSASALMLLMSIVIACTSTPEGQDANGAVANNSSSGIGNGAVGNSPTANNTTSVPSRTEGNTTTEPDTPGPDGDNPTEPEVLIKEVVKSPVPGTEQYKDFLSSIPKSELIELLTVRDRVESLTTQERLAGLTKADYDEFLPKTLFINDLTLEELFGEIRSRLSVDEKNLGLRMQLVAHLLARNTKVGDLQPSELSEALDHLNILKLDPSMNQEWLLSQCAIANSLAGDFRFAFDYADRARSQILAKVPFEFVDAFHTESKERGSDNRYVRRMMKDANRENAVYMAGATVNIAFSYRFLTGVRDTANEKWMYSIKLERELYEADPNAPNGRGKKVEEFLGRPIPLTSSSSLAPNEIQDGYVANLLPKDILPNKDYVLVIRIEDAYSPAKTKRERQLIVKVRSN